MTSRTGGCGALLSFGLSGCFGVYTPLPSDGSSSSTGGTQSSGATTTGTTTDTTTDAATGTSTLDPTMSSTGSAASTTDPSTTASKDCDCQSEIDALIVFDTALGSANPDLAAAVLQLFEVLPTIFGEFCGFHFGITTSTGAPGNPEGCQGIGALAQAGGFACGELTGRSYLDEVPQLQSLIDCYAPALITPSPLEHQPVGSVLEALGAQMNGPGGCNEGFFRPEVPLYVAIFSARDETVQFGNADGWSLEIRGLNRDSAGVSSPLGFALFGGAAEMPGETTSGGGSSSTGDDPPMCPLPVPEALLDLTNTVLEENRFVVDVCLGPDELGEAYVEAFNVAKAVCE